VTVSRAADVLGVARSTAHRLFAVLQAHGFAYQDPASRAYGAGSGLLRLGLAAVKNLELRKVARPEIERLAAELGETVHLITREGAHTFVLDSVESTEAVRVSSRIGGSMPANTTAAGKVLLSQLDAEQVESVMGPEPLPARTANSITKHAALARELRKIRERGYSTNDAENEPDIAAVSVAIPAVRGVQAAAISVAAPAMRVNAERLSTMAAAAEETAQRIGHLLERGGS
jgi:DNA-binding IclR family transcriptional regulator